MGSSVSGVSGRRLSVFSSSGEVSGVVSVPSEILPDDPARIAAGIMIARELAAKRTIASNIEMNSIDNFFIFVSSVIYNNKNYAYMQYKNFAKNVIYNHMYSIMSHINCTYIRGMCYDCCFSFGRNSCAGTDRNAVNSFVC